MNDSPASGPRSPDPFPALRVVALIAAILGVLVLAAAAFVLSYPGIHQLARTAGMSVTLARVFPVIFDALLVVAIAAVLSLHGAGWWRRGYSWLITLLLLAAMAAGGVLHAVHPHIPHRPAAITAAVLPWALLLIAFSLLLSMLRQFRQARLSPAAEPACDPSPSQPGACREPGPGPARDLDALLAGGPPASSRPSPARPSPSPSPSQPSHAARQPGPGQTVPIARPVPPPPTRERVPADQPAPSPADTKAQAAAPADTKPTNTSPADPAATGATPADSTTPTGTGWGSRERPGHRGGQQRGSRAQARGHRL